MILYLSNGNQIRGDLIKSAILRSDLSPIPLTLEADIRAGGTDDMATLLAEGQTLSTGSDDVLHIVKSVQVTGGAVQGDSQMTAYRITALLDACLGAAYVRSRAIIKENAALSAIYRATGATLKAIEADFPVPRFYCLVGDTPTFHIARLLQEEGGAVCWKAGKLKFMRLPDLFKQTPLLSLPDNASDNVDGGFLERHEVPWFFSLDATGAAVFGNQDKPRAVRFSPFKNEGRLRNMTRCLVHRKTVRTSFDARIGAGDLIDFTGGTPLAVITAAHVFNTGTDDGSAGETYSRLWLGAMEE